jgi:hypothetical protein
MAIMEDPAAAHQIVIRVTGRYLLMVSCNCLFLGRRYGYIPLASAVSLPAGEARRHWLAHMATMRENDGQEIRGAGLLRRALAAR